MRVRKNKLVIYKKGDKFYWAITTKLTEKHRFLNQEFQPVVLSYKDKFVSFPYHTWEDFRNIRDYLRVNFGLRIFIFDIKEKERTYQNLVMELMKTPCHSITIAEKKEQNDVDEEGKGKTRFYEIFSKKDWYEAEREFGFKSELVDEIFDKEVTD